VNNGVAKQLYDLENDLGEKVNVIETNPEVVKKLQHQLKDFAADIASNSRPAAFNANPKSLSN